MWFLPDFPSFSYRPQYQHPMGALPFQNAGPWGPSFPVAIVMGLFCAYVWARVKPWVSPHHDERKDYILQDITHAKSFLTNLHDQLWNAKTPPQNTESISKEGEDILLSKSSARNSEIRRRTSESITGTLAIGAHVDRNEVGSLRHKLHILGQGEHVYQICEALVLLQTRLPITSSLLEQAFDVARQGIAIDPQCTLQLGSWGVIMQSEGEVKLLRLQDGDAPVLLDSFREEGQDLRVEGIFLHGVQMRAAMGENSHVLKSKILLKEGAGWIDALIVWAPFVKLNKSSLLYATKIVEFKGVTATVRSNLIPVTFNLKPKNEDHTGLYLAAALAVAVALIPSQFWLPILGRIGVVFLPVLQLAAVILGWNLGHFLLLGEWPRTGGDHEMKLDAQEVKELDHSLYSYISPWDSAVRMEMSDLERQLAHKLESMPSVSNAGIYAQQADYRTEFWRNGVGEMDQVIEVEPQNGLPFRIRGCIKGLAGDYEGGLNDLEQALKLKPDDNLALVDRGVFRFLAGDFEGALADLDQAIKEGPGQPPDVLKLRDAIAKILADRLELAKLREENPRLKAEIEALGAKAAADLEAAQAKAAADLQALRAKAEAEAEELRAKCQKLQEDLNKAEEALKQMPRNQALELQYNNLCCEKCVRDIKAALSKVPGVESVTEDFLTGKITVTGCVSAWVVLSVCRQTSPTKVINIVGDENAPEPPTPLDPESVPKATHKPEPETTPEPAQPKAESEAAPDPSPDPAATASEPEAKAESTSEPALEQALETAAAESEPKASPEDGPAPEATPEPEIEPDHEPKVDAAPEAEIQSEAASKADVATNMPKVNGEIQEEAK